MQQVANAAHRHGKKIAFVGMSMTENAKMAQKLGYLSIPDGVEVPLDQALKMKNGKVVLMCTGSQGEPSSILGRLSAGTNRRFSVQEGDTIVLSSHPIPGNEEGIYRTINRLFRRGANVIYEPLHSVHVSGHASQDEMRLMLHLVKPKYFIPTHGELRHLKQHAIIAADAGIPSENIEVIENGQIVEFENGMMRLGDRIPGGYVFVDGDRPGEVGPSVVREREALARDGIVLVSLTLDQNGRLLDEPEIITRGFIYKRDAEDILSETIVRVVDTIDRGQGNIHDDVVQTVRSYLYNETKRRPQIFVTLSWV
jgi:ribonuclease J